MGMQFLVFLFENNVVVALYKHFYIFRFNPSSPKGVVPTPLTGFALVFQIAQPRGKIGPVTFKFILSLHFREKIPNLPPTPGVG